MNITLETLLPGLASAATAITAEYSSATSVSNIYGYSSANRIWQNEHTHIYSDYEQLELPQENGAFTDEDAVDAEERSRVRHDEQDDSQGE